MDIKIIQTKYKGHPTGENKISNYRYRGKPFRRDVSVF
jgi:hypothetical protein